MDTRQEERDQAFIGDFAALLLTGPEAIPPSLIAQLSETAGRLPGAQPIRERLSWLLLCFAAGTAIAVSILTAFWLLQQLAP